MFKGRKLGNSGLFLYLFMGGSMISREEILKELWAQIHINGHILGVVAGSGMTAKYAAMGGADFLLALSAGKFRIMGRSSFSCYLCYGNSNEIVMKMGQSELLTIIKQKPVLFGLFASDPMISLYDYLGEIKKSGFSGIVNYPTVSLIDGQFRTALEMEGNTFDKEVEAIKLAHFMDLFTIAFVTDADQARMMAKAGADVICAHFGLTKGGFLGAKKYISINDARKISETIFNACDEIRDDVIKMVYAGPANTPIDMQYMYQNTECQGYIGGSTFERIPTERAILNTTKAFKSYGSFDANDPMTKVLSGTLHPDDYVEFVKKYIEEHYMQKIQLQDLATYTHISGSYLSVKFKKEVGCSFTEYLIKFRMNKARQLFRERNIACKEVADLVGYEDYAQFSKMFKKYVGMSPAEYIEEEKEKRKETETAQ